MGELPLDKVAVPAKFVQKRGRHVFGNQVKQVVAVDFVLAQRRRVGDVRFNVLNA